MISPISDNSSTRKLSLDQAIACFTSNTFQILPQELEVKLNASRFCDNRDGI